MADRPHDLADRMAARRKAKPAEDGFIRETCALPRGQARKRARDFLAAYPQAAYMTEVESWRELPNDGIEFTMRRLRSRIERVAYRPVAQHFLVDFVRTKWEHSAAGQYAGV
jgi:hypothetical protein